MFCIIIISWQFTSRVATLPGILENVEKTSGNPDTRGWAIKAQSFAEKQLN